MSSPVKARARGATGIAVVVVAVIIELAVSCNGFREDEIECEKALVHLVECCPGLRAEAVDCSFAQGNNCNNDVVSRDYPALTLEDSACVRSRSCGALVAGGICERAQQAKRPREEFDGGAGTTQAPTPRVCAP